ncbi:MAG TPA: hypothetical protein VGG45_18905 [Terracidiphilus sp.]|jgi:hypothetical protein
MASIKLLKMLPAEKSESFDPDCNGKNIIEFLQSRSELRNLEKSFKIQVERFRGLDGEGKSDTAD